MLRYGFSGRLYPINPQACEICGLKAYPSVSLVPEAADLALISVGRALIRKGRREKVLAGDDALQLIAAFGIPVVRGITGRSPEEIKKGAAALHYPLVLKLAGKPFLHKSEWGGVTTGINNPKDLSDAMERSGRHLYGSFQGYQPRACPHRPNGSAEDAFIPEDLPPAERRTR